MNHDFYLYYFKRMVKSLVNHLFSIIPLTLIWMYISLFKHNAQHIITSVGLRKFICSQSLYQLWQLFRTWRHCWIHQQETICKECFNNIFIVCTFGKKIEDLTGEIGEELAMEFFTVRDIILPLGQLTPSSKKIMSILKTKPRSQCWTLETIIFWKSFHRFLPPRPLMNRKLANANT